MSSSLDESATRPTCNGCLDVDHGFLLAKEGRALVNDFQGGGFLDSAFVDEMLLEDIDARFAGFRVEHLANGQLVRRREGNT